MKKGKGRGSCRLCEKGIYKGQVTVRVRDKELLAKHEDFIVVHKTCAREGARLLNRDGTKSNRSIDQFWPMPSSKKLRAIRLAGG